MNKTRILNGLGVEDHEEYVLERHLHPSIYKKIRKTKKLLNDGVDPDEFRSKGGLDLDTYEALIQRWLDQDIIRLDQKKEIITSYGTLEKAPTSIGPCKKLKNKVIGTKNALVLLIEFKDKKHKVQPEHFKDLLFSKGSNHSMRDYFLEASWNQLDINGDVNQQWYTSTRNRSAYVDDPKNRNYPKAQKLVEEAVLEAKKSNEFDFSNYAKEGKIEILIVIFAGKGFDDTLKSKYIRPHKYRLDDRIEVQKGVFAYNYCLIPEFYYDELTKDCHADGIGCFCHEVGHILGLPDLYKDGYSPMVGSWCLMAVGDRNNGSRTPGHPSAWCKIHLGWTEPTIITGEPDLYKIPAVIDSEKKIYKLEVEGSNGKEYFLVENRQQKGFDRYLPPSGLLIWHVNENACKLQLPNSNPQNLFLTLEQSDGNRELEKNYSMLRLLEGSKKAQKVKDCKGDFGDAFPGETNNRTFDAKSNPNSDSSKGKKTGVSITSISDSGDVMTAKMGIKSISKMDKVPKSYKYKSKPLILNPIVFKR